MVLKELNVKWYNLVNDAKIYKKNSATISATSNQYTAQYKRPVVLIYDLIVGIEDCKYHFHLSDLKTSNKLELQTFFQKTLRSSSKHSRLCIFLSSFNRFRKPVCGLTMLYQSILFVFLIFEQSHDMDTAFSVTIDCIWRDLEYDGIYDRGRE